LARHEGHFLKLNADTMLTFEPFQGSLDDWGPILATFSDAEIFQTPAWMRFIADSHNAVPIIAVLRDGNDVAGYFAGLKIRKLGLSILGSPFVGWSTDFMGVRLSKAVPKAAVMQALLKYAFNELGCIHVEFADRQFAPEDVAGLGFDCDVHSGYILDLTPDENAIYQQMSAKSCRYCIRKSAKEGVVIEEAFDEGFADDYYAQLKDVFAKQGLVPTYDADRTRLLIKHLLPTGNLLLLRARDTRGDCIGTGIFLGINRYAYFWGNASWRQHQHLCPNEALHWYAMRYWKRRGMECYDFCGGGDYKRKYGGAEVNRYVLQKSKHRWVASSRKLAFRMFKLKQRIQGVGKRTRLAPSDETQRAAAAASQTKVTPTSVVEFGEAMTGEVLRFNERLRAGGAATSFPRSPVPAWLPKMPGRKVFEEYYLAVDGAAAVRGAYILKHQEFCVRDESIAMADFTLPISEGVVNRNYPQVAVQLLWHALQKQRLLFGLGMGGYGEALARLLDAAGWSMFSVPFFFRVVHPGVFLKNLAYLRRQAATRHLLDVAAMTGLGWLGVRGSQALCSPKPRRDLGLSTELADDFSAWADDIWRQSKGQYGMTAVRDAETLRILYPQSDARFIRLKISHGSQTIGWTVLLDSALRGHKHFGNMRLGSIVDCFASTDDTVKVVSAAREFLELRGVDLIVSNQSHAAWRRGFRQAGFLAGPSNFIFASSPKLTKLLRERGVRNDDLHLNRGDGDGPINL
jgi:hypothetical protein